MAEHEFSIGQSSDWYTPKFILDALGLVFDLDPAHPGRDNPHCVVPTRKIFTKADDGLRQPWHGLVWLNPPFGGRRGQAVWLRKFFTHGNGIALVAARTSADWFHAVVVPNAELLCFPNGKTKFHRPDGSIGKEPGTGIVLIGAGSVACTALRRSGLGACMTIDRGEAAQELALPPIKQRILDAVKRYPGIDAEALRGLVWSSDPNGGPEDRKVLHVHIHQLNQRLQFHGLRVRGSTSGGYRIVSIEELSAPRGANI